jgi:hypothetical protein
LRLFENFRPRTSNSIVFAGGALFGDSFLLRFPLRGDKTFRLHPAESRIHSSAWESCCVHDVESIPAALVDGLENQTGGMRKPD